MRVLITGGRGFIDEDVISTAMSDLVHHRGAFSKINGSVETVIHGKARRGVDHIVDKVARRMGLVVEEYPITDDEWKMLGLGAGHARNGRMLRSSRPDLVVAFPGGNGTRDMVRQAKEASVEVIYAAPF